MDEQYFENRTEREKFADRCAKAKCACKQTLARLKEDWKATNGNPYLRATSTVRYEILRSPDDTEPVDSFEFHKTNACSLKALVAAVSLAAAVDWLSRRISRRK